MFLDFDPHHNKAEGYTVFIIANVPVELKHPEDDQGALYLFDILLPVQRSLGKVSEIYFWPILNGKPFEFITYELSISMKPDRSNNNSRKTISCSMRSSKQVYNLKLNFLNSRKILSLRMLIMMSLNAIYPNFNLKQ